MPAGYRPSSTVETELKRLRTLYDLLDALTRAPGVPELYEASITSVLAATTADRAAILIFDSDGVIRFKAWRGLSGEYRNAVTGHTPWTRGSRDAQAIVIPDVLLDESLRDYQELFRREGIRSLVFVPLALTEGVFGKLVLYYRNAHECTPDELAITKAIAGHVSLATERARTDQIRAASEQRLQAILDNSNTMISLKDLQGRYLLVNRRFEELFQANRAEILGRTDHELFPREIADNYVENDRKVIAARGPLTMEEYAPLADGLHTYISVKFPLDGPDGLPAGVCGISTDITDRKRLEIARQRLAAIVESSDDAIIGEDLAGNITSWNKGAQRIFGYTPEETIGKPVTMLAPPQLPEETLRLLRRIVQGELIEHYETSRRRKDGQVIHVSLTFSPVLDESGRIIGAAKIARDITERKKAEEERATLLAREQEARRTAELLNRIAPRLLAELDPEKLVQTITATASALIGAEFAAFVGRESLDDEAGTPFSLTGVHGNPLVQAASPQLSDVLRQVVLSDHVVRRGDGDPPVRSYLSAPVISRSGETLGALFFGHSQPDRFAGAHESIVIGVAAQAAIAMDNARLFAQAKWAQSELQRSNQELRRANQDLETFAYSASHDLQEPVRTIAISAQLLDRSFGSSLGPEESAILNRILGAATHMNALIRDLLSYTRATRSAEGPAGCIDAGAVLDSVLRSLAGMIDEAGAIVTADSLPQIYAHEARLAQLFQNLIGNAIKYRGSQQPMVHVSALQRDGWVVFSVSDNGIGIEARYAEQVFGLFKRLHSRDRYPGSGIGLAICQRIVEQYGGRIWLDSSEVGRGSTFCFSLPSQLMIGVD